MMFAHQFVSDEEKKDVIDFEFESDIEEMLNEYKDEQEEKNLFKKPLKR